MPHKNLERIRLNYAPFPLTKHGSFHGYRQNRKCPTSGLSVRDMAALSQGRLFIMGAIGEWQLQYISTPCRNLVFEAFAVVLLLPGACRARGEATALCIAF